MNAQSGAECYTIEGMPNAEQIGSFLCTDEDDWTFEDNHDYQNWPILVYRVWFHFMRPVDGSGIHAGDQGAASAAAIAS